MKNQLILRCIQFFANCSSIQVLRRTVGRVIYFGCCLNLTMALVLYVGDPS
jgi:hypothetical protein